MTEYNDFLRRKAEKLPSYMIPVRVDSYKILCPECAEWFYISCSDLKEIINANDDIFCPKGHKFESSKLVFMGDSK